MRPPTNPTAIKFQELLKEMRLSGGVVEFEETTRTAADAAAAIGCTLGQIVKSIIFRAQPSGQAVLVLTSGANRVDEKLVEAIIREKLGKADADFVRTATGYAIGGVPPFGYDPIEYTYLDEDLLQYEEIWAAAGTPNAVFPLKPGELLQHTKAKTMRVSQEQK
jgi:prolyl-tRNA editing enzyme YbaK/EbsC (Cys-tRNA(Pro) deacylase)